MTGDLDVELSKSNPADPDGQREIVTKVNRWYDEDNQKKSERAAGWNLAMNFLMGNQWLQWSEKTKNYQAIPITDANKMIDRPVTNHLLRWILTNLAGFTSKPTLYVDPNSDDPGDKTRAKVAEAVRDYLWEELEKDDLYYEAALWAAATGIVIRKGFKRRLPKYVPVPKKDANGNVIEGQEQKEYLRCPDSEIVSPYNISFDGLPKRHRDINIIMESSVRRLSWIEEQYGIDLPGYTGHAGEVREEKMLDSLVGMGEALKNIVEGQRNAFTPSENEIKGCAIVKEVYHRPTRKAPMGRMLVCAGEHLLYDSMLAEEKKSPYYYLEGKVWHPYTFWNFWKMPGSIHGISLAQQLIPLQRRINSIDALIAYNRKTVAVGFWLIPSGANIPDGQKTGIPGQDVTYDPDPTGAKPELVPGTALPVQVLEERDACLREGAQIANAADIRSGQNPSGVNTLGQLQILTEQADMSRSKQVESWEKFIERSEQIDLLNFQDCYRVPDPSVIAKLKKVSKDVTNHDWTTFTGEQIQDNANVRVEKGSTIAKSRLMRQNVILKLAQLGLLGEIVMDPYLHKIFLEEFGLTNLFAEGNIDMKKAEKCIEMMLAGEYPPVLDEVDNADIQLLVLTRYMKEPKFLELDDKIKQLFFKRQGEYIAILAKLNPIADDDPTITGKKPGGARGGATQGIEEADSALSGK